LPVLPLRCRFGHYLLHARVFSPSAINFWLLASFSFFGFSFWFSSHYHFFFSVSSSFRFAVFAFRYYFSLFRFRVNVFTFFMLFSWPPFSNKVFVMLLLFAFLLGFSLIASGCFAVDAISQVIIGFSSLIACFIGLLCSSLIVLHRYYFRHYFILLAVWLDALPIFSAIKASLLLFAYRFLHHARQLKRFQVN